MTVSNRSKSRTEQREAAEGILGPYPLKVSVHFVDAENFFRYDQTNSRYFDFLVGLLPFVPRPRTMFMPKEIQTCLVCIVRAPREFALVHVIGDGIDFDDPEVKTKRYPSIEPVKDHLTSAALGASRHSRVNALP